MKSAHSNAECVMRRKKNVPLFFRALIVGRFHFISGRNEMETKVAIIGIIVEEASSVARLNSLLHQYSSIIIGRMGLPYREKNISIISIAVDATADQISALSGKIGKLPGVSAKAAYSKTNRNTEHRKD